MSSRSPAFLLDRTNEWRFGNLPFHAHGVLSMRPNPQTMVPRKPSTRIL